MQSRGSQVSLEDLDNGQQIGNGASSHFDPTSSQDDFFEQMLSALSSSVSWPELSAGGNKPLPWEDQFDEQSAFLSSKLRHHQIGAVAGSGTGGGIPAAKTLMLQQQQLLSRGLAGGDLRSPSANSVPGELMPMPMSLTGADSFELSQNDSLDATSFKSLGGVNSVQALFNRYGGSLLSNQAQDFVNNQGGMAMQAQNFGAPATAMNQAPASGSGGGTPSQPRQRVRARRGQATDPHSIAERLRRERIAERMKALQELVPNANKTDKASMLDEIIDYVKFLQLQVKVLSMSRLGGAAAVAPLVADISSEGGADCTHGSGGPCGSCGGGTQSANNDSLTVTENQVANLMEEDMGSAMQYLQGKGLCLMPISLATAISTATCPPTRIGGNPLLQSKCEGGGGPTSPSVSALTVQSANGLAEPSVRDATSISMP